MLGMGSKSGNVEGVNELVRKVFVEKESGSSFAESGLEGKEIQKEWLTNLVSGSDDAVGRRWVMARWSGQ